MLGSRTLCVETCNCERICGNNNQSDSESAICRILRSFDSIPSVFDDSALAVGGYCDTFAQYFECDGDTMHDITLVNLSNSNISGTLSIDSNNGSDSIRWPNTVITIDLSSNMLCGNVSWEIFASASNLSELRLGNNLLEGNIDLTYFCNNTFKTFDAAYNYFSSVNFQSIPKSIKNMFLDHNEIYQDFVGVYPIEYEYDLRVLKLNDNKLYGLPWQETDLGLYFWSRFLKLEFFDASHNNLSGILNLTEMFDGHNSLTYFDVSYNNIDEINGWDTMYRTMSNDLVTIDVSHNDATGMFAVENLSTFTNLERIIVNDNQLTMDTNLTFGEIPPNLRILSLVNNDFEDNVFVDFAELDDLSLVITLDTSIRYVTFFCVVRHVFFCLLVVYHLPVLLMTDV